MRAARTWPTLVLALLALVGCGDPGPAGGTTMRPPTGAGDLVLRLTALPGLLPPGGSAAVLPSFSLYGDGLLITGPASAAPGVWPAFVRRQAAVADVLRLWRQASDAGLLDGTASARSSSGVPDASVLIVTVASTTGRRTTTVPQSDGPTARLKNDLAALATGAGQPYQPSAVAVISTANNDPTAAVRIWPLAALDGQPMSGLNAGARCLVLRGNDIDAVRDAAEGATAGTHWRGADQLWELAFRPLLPDEPDCAAL